MLMNLIDHIGCNVWLVNTGMDRSGDRYPLGETRKAIKKVLDSKVVTRDVKWTNPVQPCKLGTIDLKEVA